MAEANHAYETDLETISNSDVPEEIKENVINTLRERHLERQASYLRDLRTLTQDASAVT